VLSFYGEVVKQEGSLFFIVGEPERMMITRTKLKEGQKGIPEGSDASSLENF